MLIKKIGTWDESANLKNLTLLYWLDGTLTKDKVGLDLEKNHENQAKVYQCWQLYIVWEYLALHWGL